MINNPNNQSIEELFRIRGDHLELTDPLKNHIYSNFKPILKHFPNIYDVHIDLSIDKGFKKVQDRKVLYTAKAHIKAAPTTELVATETSEDMYASIDLLCKNLDKQILKHKGKLKHHKSKLVSLIRHHGWKLPKKARLKDENDIEDKI